jgi:hypothetical protein
MIPGRVWVAVAARGPQSWDNGYSFTFISDLPAKGHRASTQFAGGHQYRGLRGRRRRPSVKLSLKELRPCIGDGAVQRTRARAERERRGA